MSRSSSILMAGVLAVSTSMYAQTAELPGKATAPQKKSSRPAAAHSKTQESHTEESPAGTPVFENAKVRVFRYELAPGVTINTGEHTVDHLLVPLGDITVAIEKGQRVRARSGEVQILRHGGKESITNTGTTQSVAIAVEILDGIGFDDVICGLNGVQCEESVLGGDLKEGSWGVNVLAKTGLIEIGTVQIDPGVTTDPLPNKYPKLLVWLTSAQIAEQAGDASSGSEAPPRLVEQAAGDTVWTPAGAPVATKNLSASQAKFVTVRFF